ncbi:MAG TPA: tetratricopeptide repeat protein [Planctomycetaceae bacterium]|jgi:tetratricopeptide (TPR) repeat protein|nr:tetratricopeptide repeat protein [Planctomycetaceae bacterium]
MPTHNSNQSHSDANHGRESTAEQARLDEAMRRADDLLVSSLKVDDRRRTRRKLVMGVIFVVLGFVAAVIVVSFTVQLVRLDSSAIAGDSEEKSAELSSEGWKLWQERSLKTAIEKFDAAVKLDPKNANAWNGLGWANFNSGNSDVAQKAFKRVIALEPTHPAALNGLGQIALSQHNYREAEEYLLKAAPQASAAWYGLARLYLLSGKYDDAEKWIQKVIATGEADPFAEQILRAAKAKKVPAELREQLEPSSTQVEVGRAWGLLNQGRRAEAKTILKGLVDKNSKDANVLNGMGWCLFLEGDAAGAKPYFERALAADPKAAGSMNGLARVLYAKGDVEGAIKIWKQMVEKIPGVHAGTVGLADAYLEKGEYDKALPLLEQWAASDPQDAAIQNKLKLARDKVKTRAKKSGA